MASKVAEAVKVVVRCRPLSKNEVAANHKRAVEMDTTMGVIKVNNPAAPNDEPKSFTFDTVFDWNSTQVNVYQATAYPIVESVLGGYNGTVFAYGQTGTGKTFTMEGIRSDKNLRGIIPNSFQHIFDKINLSNDVQYLVRVSYLEIYNEVIRDLLSNDPKAKLDLKEHPEKGVYVKDLSQVVVGSVEAMDDIMNMGNSNRTVGFTNMNATSSRSHSIFSITLESSSPGPDGKPIIRAGKLHLVDLAGSERQEKTGATGIRLKEATKINLSLSALGNVISALVDGKAQHIPYRDSKLTRLLQDSLGGNSRTVMVANLGPAEYNFDETMSTLRYANRAKNIKNKPKINEDPKDALLREYQEEIERLKVQLLQRSSKGGSGGGTSATTGGTTTTREGKVIKVNDTEAVEKMRKAKEAEMRAFLEKKDIATSERKKIEAELRAHEQRTRMEEMEQKELEERLKEMQDKVMGGNEHIIDETKKQEAILRQTATDLEKKAYEEKMLKRQLAEAQENQALKEEKYSSLQQEVDVKSKKLKKLVLKLTEAKAEVRDVQSEWQREKEDMLDSVRDLTNQLKLKMAIIDNFIPRAEAARLEQRAIWDEDVHIWRTKPITHSDPHLKSQRPGSAMANGKRPVSEYARLAKTASSDNPRFKTDNIISLSLDMPERTTQDYTVPAVAPRVQAALSAALAEEDEVTMGDWAEKKTSRSSSGDVGGNAENFPKARGIISRAGRR